MAATYTAATDWLAADLPRTTTEAEMMQHPAVRLVSDLWQRHVRRVVTDVIARQQTSR